MIHENFYDEDAFVAYFSEKNPNITVDGLIRISKNVKAMGLYPLSYAFERHAIAQFIESRKR